MRWRRLADPPPTLGAAGPLVVGRDVRERPCGRRVPPDGRLIGWRICAPRRSARPGGSRASCPGSAGTPTAASSTPLRLHGGLILPHPQGIVVGPGVVLGPRAWIFQNVTIGGRTGKVGTARVGADARDLQRAPS